MWTYTFRNIIARKGSFLATVLSVGVAVGGTMAMLGLIDSLMTAMETSGREDNAVVLKRGSRSDLNGAISGETVERIKAAPGIAQIEGRPAVSAEVATQVMVRLGGRTRFVTIRGVEPAALKVHDVRVATGQIPSSQQEAVALGEQLANQFHLSVQSPPFSIVRAQEPIVGTLAAPGTKYESEVWMDRVVLMSRLHSNDYTTVVARLESPAALAGFSDAVKKIVNQPLDVYSERAYYRAVGEESFRVMRRLSFVIAIILIFGAVSATTAAIYASFLQRALEIATLLAIGFRRSAVALSVLIETLVLVGAGGILGILAALSVNHIRIGVASTVGVVYQEPHITPMVLMIGAVGVLLISFIGSLLPILRVFRLSVISAIRE